MTFFNDLGKKLGNAAGAAADKAKELAEISKLNLDISAEEKQIQQVYLEIGKRIFERDKGNSDSPASDLCGKILVCQQNIQDLKLKISEIKNETEIEC